MPIDKFKGPIETMLSRFALASGLQVIAAVSQSASQVAQAQTFVNALTPVKNSWLKAQGLAE